MRKSMLDDCKGPRFEEVLAVFSTAVLHKIVCENPLEPGIRLAFAKTLTENELEEKLIPLIITHHSALNKSKRDGVKIREGHQQFVKLLDEKAKELSARSDRKLKATGEFLHSESIAHDVKANWLGSQDLVDTLFHGGSSVENDAFLELPFEQAWHYAKRGNIDQLSRPARVDLLQDMETFSSRQRDRIQLLKKTKKSTSDVDQGSIMKATTTSHDNRGLIFRDHQTLTVAGISKSLRESAEPRKLFDEHQAVISSLRSSLSEGQRMRVQQAENSYSSTTLVEPPPHHQPLKNEPVLSPVPDTEKFIPPASPSPSVQVTDYGDEHRATGADSTTENAPIHLPSDIATHFGSDLDDSSSSNPEPELQSNPEPEPTRLPLPQFEPRPSSLLERTRQSMSLLPPPSNSRSRQSLAARRETRQSQLFPINQFQTPPKEVPEQPSRSGASTPRDDLFSEEAEYASIFKSRPRVATSPLMSPAVPVGFDYDAEEYVEDGESRLGLAIEGSPLAMKKR